jgi:lipoic acid synthetase/lipoate-protein ligase A
MGRNQVAHQEVNLDFCRENHIDVIRRKSGGGAIFADEGNIMVSLVTTQGKVEPIFLEYATTVSRSLNELGAHTEVHGRNDVILMGKGKVCGNAFYHIADRNIVHGTMLYDTDMLNMAGALTPPTEKLLSKGVQSIHQHIDVLKNHISLGLEEFMEFVLKELCHDELMLTQDDIRQIELLEQEYLSDEFIYGKNPRYTIVKKRRMEGVGDFEARIEVKNGIIKSVNLMGDFFLVGDLDNGLLKKLRNIPLEAGALNRILPDRIDDIVMNLMKEDFINLLTA